MVCESYGNVIVCGPPRGVYKRIKSKRCPSCEEEHGFVERWDGAYYGVTLYGSCGDTWSDGYRHTRPFARYWRRDAQSRFQSMWDHAAPDELYEQYVKADVEIACSNHPESDGSIGRRRAAHDAITNNTSAKES
jgi:hypothetical protein